jgi:N-acetyl-S-(2-succino)cysteine monooxygenase
MIPEFGLRQLSLRFNGIDLSGYPLDGPVPLHVFPRPKEVVGPQSRSQLIFDAVERDGLTLRQLLRLMAGAQGHRVFAGTPEQLADHIVEWVDNGAADGFNIMPPYLPSGLSDFVDQVVPLLQKRGVFRIEYEGTTLRDHYGLSRPESRFAKG